QLRAPSALPWDRGRTLADSRGHLAEARERGSSGIRTDLHPLRPWPLAPPKAMFPEYRSNGNVMNYSTDFPSIKNQVSPEEWQARLDLAACYRLVDIYGMTDLIYNHITARVPGEKDIVLLNLYGLLYKEITASSLVKIHVDGEIIWKPDTDYDINKSGYVIHGAVHKARPDVACVLHTHTRAGMAVA